MASDENRDDDTIVGERGASNVAGKRGKNQSVGVKIAGVFGLLAAAGLFLWVTQPKEKAEAEKPKQVVRQTVDFEPAPPPPPPPAPLTALPSAPPPVAPEQKQFEDKMLAASQRAPVLAFNKGGNQGHPSGGSASGAPQSMPYGVPSTQQPGQNELEAKLKATPVQGVSASHMGNRDYIISMGTSIPCILETAMASDVPGFVTCRIERDIMSDNGRVVLLDKGSQVVGEYQGGLKRGQSRMFVLWTRAKTPQGVIIQLASPATDGLGRAGFDGNVDTHFWERFGSAMLMSVVGDAGQIATTYVAGRMQPKGNGNTTNNYQPPQSIGTGMKDAASIAVENSINIPPTLNKNQGDLVNIMVARDLYFGDVYGLRVTETKTQIFDRTVTGDFSPPVRKRVTK